MHRFRLVDEDGIDLGPLVSARAIWRVGEIVSRRPDEKLKVVNVVPAEAPEGFLAYLVVQQI
jgi:hypothetical protein